MELDLFVWQNWKRWLFSLVDNVEYNRSCVELKPKEMKKAQKYINDYKKNTLLPTLNFEGDLMVSENQLVEMLQEFTEQQLLLYRVSQQRELLDLLTEIANSDTLYSNTRHRMIARKLLKSNCG